MRVVPLRNTGAALSPHNAFLILQGIETPAPAHGSHLRELAGHRRGAAKHPKGGMGALRRPEGSPDHALVQRQLGGARLGHSVVQPEGRGRRRTRRRSALPDALKLFTRLVNIGDAKSLATHPASTTHRQLDADELAKAGVSEGMVRLSIGIEHIDDLMADLTQALDAV